MGAESFDFEKSIPGPRCPPSVLVAESSTLIT
jgi:hypothetical protein